MSYFDDYVADGLFCEQCGTSVDGEEPGYVRVCHTCQLHGDEYCDNAGAPNRAADTNTDLLEALEQCVDALASLRGEHEPPMTQVVRGRAAIAKAKGGAA